MKKWSSLSTTHHTCAVVGHRNKAQQDTALNTVKSLLEMHWAVKIVTGVPDAIPLIGSELVVLLRGDVGVGQTTLTRFYSLHTFVLPLLTAVFILIHFLIIRKQGISGPLLVTNMYF